MTATSSRVFADRAMAFMAEREIAPTPDNFQLFYTYASGDDPALTQAIAKLLAARTPFTHALVDELQARFTLSKKVESAIGDLSFGMSGALSEVLDQRRAGRA